MTNKVILLGSGPSMLKINDYDTCGIPIVGVNNVWRGTDKWDHIVHPTDYKTSIPVKNNQLVHCKNKNWCLHKALVHYAKREVSPARALGPTMYFSAAYWTMYYLKPKYIGFLGFDMDYTPSKDGSTAFYGIGYDIKTHGSPDPFRQMRFFEGTTEDNLKKFFKLLEDNSNGTKFFNLSDNPNSLLPWTKITFEEFKELS